MRILVKIGGASIEEATGRRDLAASVAAARDAGHEVVLVHGGGNQIRALTKRLGIVDRYHEGLRVTDAAVAEAVLMVLGGSVNRAVVAALEAAGVRACGLTGADGSTFTARKHVPDGHDLGFVGEVDRVRPQLALTLLAAGVVPVLATVAPGDDGDGGLGSEPFYNVNADMAAGPLAKAFGAAALLFLTDVPGVLDGEGARLARLTPADCARLTQQQVIRGGMLPKVGAALAALAAHPGCQVKIAPAGGADAIRHGLDAAVGTLFTSAHAPSTTSPSTTSTTPHG